ncbi:uncharacterized protein CC84DRAFT_1160770 [Paraphaeosphaeria sporulosa]|uniref:Zn(2)-C6 fungal-type domain-containing protein n=1 Tax=Paraphaeosphaeria sporulosa TaxID=1460663 RepID=A0A177CQT4_9PLEO|nr:uncharacterized protein CC84DRAFT_1160770 [Paraphaeosphaeria sporulosa]OAG09666.1 hypothetical protein CC84DRAFT_1160770 [Paraphaeosphaeria sporulosa]
MDRPANKLSAPYGHACSNCVKAKCKCVPRQGGGCERCNRLSKECQPATFVRKTGSQKTARKSQLEDKLDSLVTLLQAQQAPAPSLTPSPSVSTTQAEVNAICLQNPHLLPTSQGPIPFPSERPPKEILSQFRSRYLEQFPFFHVLDLTANNFVRERPNTYRAIQVICEKSRARQNEYGPRVREELILRVVTNGERSIDLLLCLLVCLTWQVYFTPSRRGGMGMFLNVTKHVISDLGFNRPTDLVMACPKPPVIVGQLPDQHESHNDEERRALIACFALSAMTALAIKAEPMRWSSRIARACDNLSQNLDNTGDIVLVAMARISRVSVDAYNTLQQIQDDPPSAAYALHQVKALRAMLDMVKSGLSQAQLQNKMVLLFLYGTEVQIYEPALFAIAQTASNDTLDYQRIEYLTACLQACKDSLDNYLAIPSITMNMIQVLAFSNSCQVLYSLSVLECPGWDRYTARATVDVLWYFDRVCVKFEEARRQLAEESGSQENVFALAGGHEGLKSLCASWRENLESATGVGMNFTGELGGVGDAWMTNADMWFTNVWGDTQF